MPTQSTAKKTTVKRATKPVAKKTTKTTTLKPKKPTAKRATTKTGATKPATKTTAKKAPAKRVVKPPTPQFPVTPPPQSAETIRRIAAKLKVSSAPAFSWDDAKIGAESVAVLRDLLRLDTTNPPGNEISAVNYIADILKREGIESQIFESAPGRGNLVASLKGDGSQKPFLLMGHVDVVPVEADKWEHPPFGAEIHDGYIYARGALDMKNTVAIELMTFILLKRMGVPLKRDVIFMANADEEAGGIYGAKWMVENKAALIRAEYGLNEGGGNLIEVLGKKFITCQTGEKGNSRFRIRTHGTPGHGSQPHKDNPILHLSDALIRMGEARLPIHVTKTARLYIESIARQLGPDGEALLGLLDPATWWDTLEQLPVPALHKRSLIAMFTNTAVPTILNAGQKANVIPSIAEAQIDSRKLPGSTNESFLLELRQILPPSVEIEFLGDMPGIEAEPDSPLFDTIKTVMARYVPDAPVIPTLVVGGTDARHQTKLGTKVYGFSPSLTPVSDHARVHGHNERILVDDVLFGVKAMYDIVAEFCGQ
jgi:acetylornithine deacetylase/succinyl-diaminopimelate desuccinylase-like protein